VQFGGAGEAVIGWEEREDRIV